MRIAFISDVAAPWVKGGVQFIERSEMLHLAKKHEVYLFSLKFDKMKSDFAENGIHHITFRDTKINGLYVNGVRSISLAREFAKGIRKTMNGYNFDLVVANAFPYLHLNAIKRYCKNNKTFLIIDVAEVWSRKEWTDYLGKAKGYAAYAYMKIALKGADYYIANSSITATKLESLGIHKSKISIFSPVVDISAMDKIKAHKSSKCVLFVGRLVKEKRAMLWLKALKDAHGIDATINGLIIGDGPEKAAIKRRIKEWKMGSYVKLVPFFKEKLELYKLIKSSSLLFNPSSREGLSAITLESLALGTPVLLPSDTPIPKEVKEMCIIKGTEELPKAIADIVSNIKKYENKAKTSQKLKDFDVNNITAFFSKFEKLERIKK